VVLLELTLRVSAELPSMPGVAFTPGMAEISWAAPTNDLRESLWIYRSVKQEISPTVISNLLWLGGFTKADVRKPPSDMYAIKDRDALYCEKNQLKQRLVIFPSVGFIEYSDEAAADRRKGIASTVPSEEEAFHLALKCLRFVGADSSQIPLKPGTTNLQYFRTKQTYSYPDKQTGERIEKLVLRGVCFGRWIDRIPFNGIGTEGGAMFDFGAESKVSKLQINWRQFQPERLVAWPTPEQFIERMQRGLAKAVELPPAEIKKVKIIGASPFYRGLSEEEKQPFLYPFAQLDLVVETVETNQLLHITCPIAMQ
jgi:hypothetical protein